MTPAALMQLEHDLWAAAGADTGGVGRWECSLHSCAPRVTGEDIVWMLGEVRN